MKPETGKRIVNKREYMRIQGKRLWLYFNCVATLFVIPMLTYNTLSRHGLSPFWFTVIVVGVPVMFLSGKIKAAKLLLKEARSIPGVQFLTRANAADLPAPDSLVRASTEPLQVQNPVLLRAGMQGQDTPVEQLVPAVNGQESGQEPITGKSCWQRNTKWNC